MRLRAGSRSEGVAEQGALSRAPGLLDMSGRPLLYSPAFCRFDMNLMSQRSDTKFTCGG